ncbi:MarR family winged helix-turn-helix transcriptional regulator [Desulfonatronum lacustre]|uniref:MarR family winged helix-turn-helix transcriptional regulator n=1 Tax=Desulfonatronum lacustre TaxID=66849 RepID=UPI0004B9486A|nr:MarR family transcriptional regulator [Desulfonatronum lacustre]SMP66142.1 DNA-binding transcriptional regulator, MarR family [Desulfonatronum zhilinae]
MAAWMEKMLHMDLEDSPGFLVNRAALRIKREFHRLLEEQGYSVTPEQCVVLWRLWSHEGGVQRELASTTFKDMTNMTRILDGLERRQLVVRQRDEHDRRCSRIFLTAEGRALREGILGVAGQLAEQAYRGLSEKQIREFKDVLSLIYSNLNDAPKAEPSAATFE